ncbi:hypothetical protein BC830DRAFT_1139516 [Chytriomyces sp. MP71]|nr:hypothetical protein BC830DRAFT_1139516 [Chytriomyces sp. MP71]
MLMRWVLIVVSGLTLTRGQRVSSTTASVTVSSTTMTAPPSSSATTSISSSTGNATSPSTLGNQTAPAAVTQAPINQVGGSPSPRYGASAQLLTDQGLIVFFGGYVGTPQNGYYVDLNTPFEMKTTDAVVTLSVTQAFTFSTGNWQTITNTGLTIPAKNMDVEPRVSAYGVSAVARGLDVGSQSNAEAFYYVFGQNYNTLMDATVYQYNQGNNMIGVLNKQSNPPSSRDRAVSCMVGPSTLLIHGGLSGTDNDVKTVTLQSTWLLDLKNISGTENAWSTLDDNANSPPLHDHVMACLRGNAYMVGGVSDKLGADGNALMAMMDHLWVYSYTESFEFGTWTMVNLTTSATDGFPTPRRAATLTALDDKSDILLLHGGTTVDYGETFNDLWQLNVKSFTWKKLTPSKYTRHSHNAIAVNGMLVTAFGVMSDANSTKVPNVVTPPLWVYNSITDSWGGFPVSAVLPPGPAPAFAPHVPAITASNQGTTIPPAGVSPAILYGSIGGIVAVLLAVCLVFYFHRRRVIHMEKHEKEQEIAEQMEVEDSDRNAALVGIMGHDRSYSRNSRIVGGKLGRIIEQNATGIKASGYDYEVDEEIVPTQEVKDKTSIGSFSSAQIRFMLEDDILKDIQTTAAKSVGGTGGIPKSPNSDHGGSDGSNEKSGGSSELGKRPASIISDFSGRPTSFLGPFLGAKASTDDVRAPNPNRSSRLFVKEETTKAPLRPWELPGMGVQQKSRPASRLMTSSTVATSSSSTSFIPGAFSSSTVPTDADKKITLAGLIGELPEVDEGKKRFSRASSYGAILQDSSSALNTKRFSRTPSYSAMMQPGAGYNPYAFTPDTRRFSSYSSSSSTDSFSNPSTVEFYDPDPNSSMRALFSRFTNEQILFSWNAYSAATGHVYTLEQVEAMRQMHAPGSSGAARSESASGSEVGEIPAVTNVLRRTDSKSSPLTTAEPISSE